jgi:hypothetical protein
LTIFIVSVSAGAYHNMALSSDGQVFTWGSAGSGQIGDTYTVSRTLPVRVKGLLSNLIVTSIGAGFDYSVALASNGQIYSWGYNNKGQLGDNTTVSKSVPTLVVGIKNVTRISVGGAYMMAIDSAGNFTTWGDNSKRQLGTGTNATKLVPSTITKIFTQTNITAMFASVDLTYPTSFQLWDGMTCFSRFAEDTAVCANLKGICVAQDYCQCTGYYNGADCATFNCFGKNNSDPTTCSGQGSCIAADSCVCYPGYRGVQCEYAASGFAYAIGDGSTGKMGDSYLFSYTVPSPVGGPIFRRIVTSIAAGATISPSIKSFTVAIVGGEAYAWGDNSLGKINSKYF